MSFWNSQNKVLCGVKSTGKCWRHDVINDVIQTSRYSKMALSTEVVKLYYKSYSPVTVIRSMQKLYPDNEKLIKMQEGLSSQDQLLIDAVAMPAGQNQSGL